MTARMQFPVKVNNKVLFREGETVDIAKVIRINKSLFLKNLDGDRIPLRDVEIIQVVENFDFFNKKEVLVKEQKEVENHNFLLAKLKTKKTFIKCDGCLALMNKILYIKHSGLCPKCR